MKTVDLSAPLYDEEGLPLEHHTGEHFTVRRALTVALIESNRHELAARLEGELSAEEIEILRNAAMIFRPAIAQQLHRVIGDRP